MSRIGRMPIAVPAGVTAVSYTHLDVYKRQVLGFNLGHTRESVQSPLVVLRLSAKRRRLFLWQIRL